jgi:hypothetical protein
MNYKTLQRKLMIGQRESHWKGGWTHVLRKGRQSLFHPSCYSCYKPVISREWGNDRIVITTNGTYRGQLYSYTDIQTELSHLPHHDVIIISYTVEPVLRGHLWDKEKWHYKTGDLLKEVQVLWNFLSHD